MSAKTVDATKTTSVILHPKVLTPIIVGFVVNGIAWFAASKGLPMSPEVQGYGTLVLMAIVGYFAPNAP